MCLLVTRAPTSTLAQASLAELDRVGELFESAVDKSQVAANNVVGLSHYVQSHHSHTSSSTDDCPEIATAST